MGVVAVLTSLIIVLKCVCALNKNQFPIYILMHKEGRFNKVMSPLQYFKMNLILLSLLDIHSFLWWINILYFLTIAPHNVHIIN